jgi:hypothetical protein
MTRPKEFLAWAAETFGPIALDREERLLRFLEEAIELAHAEGMMALMLECIIDRVYSRPAGAPLKEIAQCQATLECFAESIGCSSDALASQEFDRVRAISKEQWAARHKAKVDIGIAK